MTESVIADFMTDVVPDAATHTEPTRGRVVMSKRRIVVATGDAKRSIPVDGIFDVQLGRAPQGLEKFFEDTVTIGYQDDTGTHVTVVEGAGDTVERFTTLLFKAVCNGATVEVKHAARRGGRVTNNPVKPASLFLTDATVEFRGDHSFTIEISSITAFERIERDFGTGERPVLSVRHVDGAEQVTTEIALASERHTNVLERFLRIEYDELRAHFEDVTVSDDEVAALVSIYTAGPQANLAAVMGIDASRAQLLTTRLTEKDLLDSAPDGLHLTPLGQLAVSHRIEDVNV